MSYWKELILKMASYLYPFSKKIRSEYSGDLELTWSFGKKTLDTANANYSYGPLQKVLKFALSKIDFSRVENILLLGLGGGSVIETLLSDFAFKGNIRSVEFDKTIIKIAKDEFGIEETKNLRIINLDAFDYVISAREKYDLILIDLFIDNKIPEKFLGSEFLECLLKLRTNRGIIIYNSIMDPNITPQLRERLQGLGLNFKEFEKVEKTNVVFILDNKQGLII